MPIEATEANETFNKLATMLREVCTYKYHKTCLCIHVSIHSVHQLPQENQEAEESKSIKLFVSNILIVSLEVPLGDPKQNLH